MSTLHCSIFGFEGSDAEDIVYVNWLNMVRAGVVALEYYTPETKKWRQVRGCEDRSPNPPSSGNPPYPYRPTCKLGM